MKKISRPASSLISFLPVVMRTSRRVFRNEIKRDRKKKKKGKKKGRERNRKGEGAKSENA